MDGSEHAGNQTDRTKYIYEDLSQCGPLPGLRPHSWHQTKGVLGGGGPPVRWRVATPTGPVGQRPTRTDK
eukprot:7857308-Alexandrium_andersonii.AAC.1